ncbi:MAG TPA: hypothetical protein VGQ52_15555, partial [Gemmatimonadaceae bacterium]|nr:hypothetical protein [Gemmatimonadaceae bacterium]
MTIVGLLGLVFSRCAGGADAVATSRKAATVASVAVFLAGDVLLVGDTTSARVEVRNEAHRLIHGREVTWTTAEPTTAAVSVQGIVSAMGYGTTEVLASVDGVSGAARVYILDSTTAATAPAIEPEPPRDSVDVSWIAPSGRTINVRRGDNLQSALESAKRGDEVVLEAGVEFRGHFQLPAKGGEPSDGWITLRTSALDQLPPQGTRIDPAQHAALMPKLITNDERAALYTETDASGWRVVGI